MTAQFLEDISGVRDCCKGKACWIAGSGTSLDRLDLSRLKNQLIISLNATILRTVDLSAEVWWLYWDKRLFYEVRDRLFGMKPRRIQAFLTKAGTHQMREWKGQGRYFAYAGFTPKRSVLETGLMIAEFLGFAEAYLIGVDGFNSDAKGRAYCKGLEWKHVRFMQKGSPKTAVSSSSQFMNALRDVKTENLKTYCVSDLFPEDGPFEKSTFEECLERSRARNAGTTPRLNQRVGSNMR